MYAASVAAALRDLARLPGATATASHCPEHGPPRRLSWWPAARHGQRNSAAPSTSPTPGAHLVPDSAAPHPAPRRDQTPAATPRSVPRRDARRALARRGAPLMSHGPVHFPLGPFTPHENNPVLSPRVTAGSPEASTTPPRSSWTTGLPCCTGPTRTTSSRTSASPGAMTATVRAGAGARALAERGLRQFGCEDARLTAIDGTYYLTYTGWDREHALLCLATSSDLRTWTKHGPLFPDFDTFQPQGRGAPGPWSKAGGILPVKVNGPLAHVLRRGLHLDGDLGRPAHWTPTGAGLGDAADGSAPGDVQRLPRRGRAHSHSSPTTG